MQCGSPKNGPRDNLGIPMNANVVSGLVVTHPKGEIGPTGAVNDLDDGLKDPEGVFVGLQAMHLDTRGIHHLDMTVIDRKVRWGGE